MTLQIGAFGKLEIMIAKDGEEPDGCPCRWLDLTCVSDVARAAYLAAAGQRLVDAAAAHARNRVQFGRPIGDFQAVAHPLADCASRLLAARTLARVAAFWIDCGSGDSGVQAATARLSAGSAALESAHVAHQVFGAVGITLEGPAFAASRCIRQLVSLPPGEAFARASVLTNLGL